jgi:hypothetical protein
MFNFVDRLQQGKEVASLLKYFSCTILLKLHFGFLGSIQNGFGGSIQQKKNYT